MHKVCIMNFWHMPKFCSLHMKLYSNKCRVSNSVTSLLIIYLTQQSEQYWFEGYGTQILRGPGSLNIRHWTLVILLILSGMCAGFFFWGLIYAKDKFLECEEYQAHSHSLEFAFVWLPCHWLTEFVLRVPLYQKWFLCALLDGQRSKNLT